MRRRVNIVIFILSTALIGGVVWLTRTTPSDPVYKGKHCSAWLEEWTFSTKGSSEAKDAIIHIDTNALPCMLRMLATKDSAFKKRLIELSDKQRLVSIHWHQEKVARYCASYAFAMFGPRAMPAVPGLMKLLTDDDHDVRGRALEALASIGPSASNAIPAVVKVLEDKDERLVERARSTLKIIGPDPAK